MTRPLVTVFALVCAAEAFGGSPAPAPGAPPPGPLAAAFRPPEALRDDLGPYRSPLAFRDGRPVRDADDWGRRKQEIRAEWHAILGAWPPVLERPRVETLGTERRDGHAERRVRVEVAAGRTRDGYLLVPDGAGPFPAVLVVFYEPETAVGRGRHAGLDFSNRLARRGFVSLSLGVSPDQITPGKGYPEIQPLSYLAYVAANAYHALATLPEVDPKRVGVMGHSYGGKWALFAWCLYDKFACGVWSDPGVVFDESRPNVNYWEPWYLGWEPGRTRKRGVVTKDDPRTGAYRTLVERGHDLHELHALMAPRPFFVSGGSEDPAECWRALNHAVAVNRLLGFEDRVAMTNRPGHNPTEEAHGQILAFLEFVLKGK